MATRDAAVVVTEGAGGLEPPLRVRRPGTGRAESWSWTV